MGGNGELVRDVNFGAVIAANFGVACAQPGLLQLKGVLACSAVTAFLAACKPAMLALCNGLRLY